MKQDMSEVFGWVQRVLEFPLLRLIQKADDRSHK